jgi:hypothetical protein
MRETIMKEEDHQQQPPLDSTEDYLIQLLVQQSVIDAKDFDILTLEQVEELKKVIIRTGALACLLLGLLTALP